MLTTEFYELAALGTRAVNAGSYSRIYSPENGN